MLREEARVRIAGEDAKRWAAVRLDTLEQVNTGVLTLADDLLGTVEWCDKTGNTRTVSLGPQAIRLIRAYRYGR